MSEFLPQLIQQLFNGLSLGAIYALIAIGYTMVYGIIGMINFAHGEIYMIGAYAGLVTLAAIGTQSGLPVGVLIALMLLVAVLVTGTYGFVVEQVAALRARGIDARALWGFSLGMPLRQPEFTPGWVPAPIAGVPSASFQYRVPHRLWQLLAGPAYGRAALEYRASLSFVESKVRTLTTAITGQ